MKIWCCKSKKQELSPTKPEAILKRYIAFKTNQWHENKTGLLKANTVILYGDLVTGMFVYTINFADIAAIWDL